MDRILIPARRNSKRYPFKNRFLLGDTISKIPKHLRHKVAVITDDDWIYMTAPKYGVEVQKRTVESAADEASTKIALQEYCNGLPEDAVITMLYLTYPERLWLHVEEIWSYWKEKGPLSLLCRKKAETHPYLCITNVQDNTAEQFIGAITGENHDLCRMQEYPEVWEISHYIGMFRVWELQNLNRNLYNRNTHFYPIDSYAIQADIDEPNDQRKRPQGKTHCFRPPFTKTLQKQ